MSAMFFVREGTPGQMIGNCADFSTFCINAPINKNVYGSPYGKLSWKIPIFQNLKKKRINPFWVNFFNCKGEKERPSDERLLQEQALSVLAKLSPAERQTSVSRKTSKRCSCEMDPSCCDGRKPLKRIITPSSPSFNYDTMGNSKYNDDLNRISNSHETHIVTIHRETKVSVKTPGFKSMLKRNLPWNNFSQTKLHLWEEPGTVSTSTRPPCNGVNWWKNGFVRGYGTPPQPLGYTGTPMATSDLGTANAALMTALLRSKSMKVNLAQAYGERKQTVNLLTTNVNRVLSLAIMLKNRDIKAAKALILGSKGKDTYKKLNVLNRDGTHIVGKRYVHLRKKAKRSVATPEEFANLWLEYSYGWRPLINDIYGSCESIANTYHLKKPVEVSAVKTAERTTSTLNAGYQLGGVVTCNPLQPAIFADRIDTIRRSRTKVKFQFREFNEWSQTMSKTGIADPALLAWELLPYSFVIDWFVPVGKYLSSLNAMTGLNFIRGSTATVSTTELTSTVVMATPGYGIVNSVVKGVNFAKSRSIYTTAPMPRIPAFQPELSIEKGLSAISLMTQLFTRGKTTVRV